MMVNNELYQLNEINDIALQGLLEGQELVLINNKSIQNINLSAFQLNRIIIKNCKNLKTIAIRDQENLIVELYSCNNVISVVLANCKVSTLTISYSKITRIELLYLEISQYLHLDKVTNERLEIRQSKKHQYDFIRNITLTNCTLDSIYILNIKSDQIYFSDSVFTYISLNEITAETIDFDHVSIIAAKRALVGIRFFKVLCLSYFTLRIVDHIYSSKVKFIFDDLKLNGETTFVLCDSKDVKSEYQIILNKVSAFGGITFSSDNWYKLITGKINFFPNDEGYIIFNSLNFDKLTISGFNTRASLNTLNSDIHHMFFENFNNKGVVKIINSEVFDTLEVVNSDIDNVVIRPLIVKNLKLSQGSFLGGMKVDGSNALSLENTELSSETKQEYYRQLKQAAKTSNNKFLELEYKAKEMQHYKPSGKAEWFSHWINSLSNHGTDWGRPLIYILFWNLVIWLLISYKLYTSYFVISLQKGYSLAEILVKLSFGIWIILNPVSRMSEFTAYLEYKPPVHGFVPFLFFAAKIINGILIYQMITAFRKWVGKD